MKFTTKGTAMNKHGKTFVTVLPLAIAGILVTVNVALADCFGGADTDSSGAVSYDEFIAAGGSCAPSELERIFNAADVNADGELDCDEFAEAAEQVALCQS